MHTKTVEERALTRRATVIALIFVVLSVTLITAIVYSALTANAIEIDRERALLRNALREFAITKFDHQRGSAWWDDAVVSTRKASWDQEFIDVNLGYFFYENYENDEIYIVSLRGDPSYAFFDNEPQPPSTYAQRRTIIDQLLERLDTKRPRPTDDVTWNAQNYDYETLAPILKTRGWSIHYTAITERPALVVATEIAPTIDASVAHDEPQILITVTWIDPDVVTAIGDGVMLEELTITSAPSPRPGLASAALPLDLSDTSFFFTWRHQTPGDMLLYATMPFAMLVIAASGLLLTVFIQGLRHASSRLAEEKRHAEALAVEAKQAAVAKSRFLATMSHELRTPLNGIMGMLQVLSLRSTEPKSQKQIQVALDSADYLLALLNDVLDFSKLEVNALQTTSEPFEVGALIEDCVALMAPVAEQKGLTLAVDIAADAPVSVEGDAIRVRQVLNNLLNNALKFTDAGEVRVAVARQSAQALIVRVEDTGIGMPSESLGHIFERFSQVDDSATRRAGGSGLGLAICKQLVEIMGGRIGVSSTLGGGSTFWFTLPIRAPARLETRPATPASAPTSTAA